jgi:hypothetical protein
VVSVEVAVVVAGRLSFAAEGVLVATTGALVAWLSLAGALTTTSRVACKTCCEEGTTDQ